MWDSFKMLEWCSLFVSIKIKTKLCIYFGFPGWFRNLHRHTFHAIFDEIITVHICMAIGTPRMDIWYMIVVCVAVGLPAWLQISIINVSEFTYSNCLGFRICGCRKHIYLKGLRLGKVMNIINKWIVMVVELSRWSFSPFTLNYLYFSSRKKIKKNNYTILFSIPNC